MNEATKEFFRRQQQDPDNQECVDNGTANPQWASVSHGCYISLESSGVHRGLGVHISFVRSITMDSWKPLHLKLMELGGNRKLKDFLRLHNISDDMPILQKYNTRAAEWYRKNLRAMAEGLEPPAPLPEGTGHLPSADVASAAQVVFSSAAMSGGMSPGGASASDARHYSGYHESSAGGSSGSTPAAPRSLQGFGSNGPAPAHSAPRDGDDFFTGMLGNEVGAKVSDSFWSAFSATKNIAKKAKDIATDKVAQAQNEGWIDVVKDTAKQAADSAKQASLNTYTFVEQGGGKAVLEKTTEALGTTAKTSLSMAGNGIDWVTGQIGMLDASGGRGASNASALQGMSSGRMQGFGSDCPPPSSSQAPGFPAGSGSSGLASASSIRPYHEAVETPPAAGAQESTAAAPAAAAASSAPKVDVWKDEDWGDWS